MRKLELAGEWWGQRTDGSWLRWDHARGDWRPAARPPATPAAVAVPEVFALPVSSGTRGWEPPDVLALLKGFLLTYLTLASLSLVALLLLMPFLFLLDLMFLFLFGPMDVGAFVRETAAFLAVYLLFVSAAAVIARRAGFGSWWSLLGWAAAAGIVIVGGVVARPVGGLPPSEGVLDDLNVATMLGLVTCALVAGLQRAARGLHARFRRVPASLLR